MGGRAGFEKLFNFVLGHAFLEIVRRALGEPADGPLVDSIKKFNVIFRALQIQV